MQSPFTINHPPFTNKFALPNLGFGLGLRSKHFDYIFEHKPKIGWFEIISENYMDSHGQPRENLSKIRESYPIVMHGVSLSIGSTDRLNKDYLRRLKAFADDIKPEWISDHLCWTGINGKNTHDLLPVPLTEESLEHIIPRIKEVQDYLGRPILIENPSTYLTFRADNIPEYEFMAKLAEGADCGILLDVNNVYVSSFNHRLDAKKYIDNIPAQRVVQIHLAGHHHAGNHIVDTHDDHVTNAVWDLYSYTTSCIGACSTMIEWDGNIPEFPVLEAELQKAKRMTDAIYQIPETNMASQQSPITNHHLIQLQENLQTAIHEGITDGAEIWILPKENFQPQEQLRVYIEAYRLRIRDVLSDDYAAVMHFLGKHKSREVIKKFIDELPSEYYSMADYSSEFAKWLQKQPVSDFAKDLADLEQSVSECFNLPDSEALSAQEISKYSPEEFVGLKISPRTASYFRRYKFDINSYYTSFYHGKKPKPNLEPKEICLMIYRKEGKVFRQEISYIEYELLQQMRSEKTLENAMVKTISITKISEEQLAANLQNWFGYWLPRKMLNKIA